jgi:selenobiotic family peptide radical SAM maturase
MPEKVTLFKRAYPATSGLVDDLVWKELVESTSGSLEELGAVLQKETGSSNLPEYLVELAPMELHAFNLKNDETLLPATAEKLTVNPTLQLFMNSWKGLTAYLDDCKKKIQPAKGEEQVIVWLHPLSKKVRARTVSEEDLLVLKLVMEELSAQYVAEQGDTYVAAVDGAIIRALYEGIIIGPESGITRDYSDVKLNNQDEPLDAARIFTLQWHITQACDLHCRHCYDRDQYASLPLAQGIAILDDLADFCATHNVYGQITFTGGNPLLHPDFEELYGNAADRGFTTAILGNPAAREKIDRLMAIQPLAFYQVSLEGLEQHNDYMRGQGHFKRVLDFLDVLRQSGVYSMVMLTLTRENMDQVLELGEILRDRADLFTFNRLSLVGEGANLVMADPPRYPEFLHSYLKAAEANPCIGLKDNLLNILCDQENQELFGGCTGYGCGAAFNFLSVLANGEVHACRKFPSPLGNLLDQSLNEIYHSQTASRYRAGPEECVGCKLRQVCRGCLAVSYSHGHDIFTTKDPYCFIEG